MAKANILIVEDDAIIAMDLESRMKKLGYGVAAIVGYGEQAIEKVKENTPDLVLMDIILKGEIDGIEAAEEIRTQYDIPVIFITGYADKERLKRAKLTYPFGFIIKPFDDKDLEITTEMALYIAKVDAGRKQAEDTLFKEQYFLKKAQEIGHIGTWELDVKKNELLWTDENYRIFGLPIGTELTYETFLNCVHPDDREYVDAEWKAAFNKKPYDIEHRLLVDGKVKWVREKAELEFNEKDECIRGIGFTQDITEHKQAEKALRESEEKYRALFENMGTGVAIYEVKGNAEDFIFTDFNKAAEKIDNQKKEELIGRSIFEARSGVEEFGLIDAFREVWKTGKPKHHPIALYHDDKLTGWYDNFVYKLPANEIVAIFSNETERKQAEEALRKNEVFLQEAQRVGHLGSWDLNVVTGDLQWSDECYRIYGFRPLEFVPTYEKFRSIVHPEDLGFVQEQVDAALNNAKHYDVDFRFVRPNGKIGWIHCEGEVMRDAEGKPLRFFGTQIDITERKQAEEALRESEEKYRALVKNITSIVYKGYKDWSVEFFDEKIELLTGYDVDEFNSKKMKWSDIIVKEDIETAREIFITALKTDKSYVREYRINYKAGGIHWIEERGHIFCDNRGEVEYISGTFFDKTEIKKLEAQLQQAQKLESVGILAGGIAHDFNNLLSIIMGNISMTKDDVKPEYGVTDFLNEAEEASLKAKELTNQLITFSKGGAPVKKVGSIGNLVKETTNLILSYSNVKSEFIFPDDLWLVEFDEGQMKHAVKNIIDNAVESTPDSGAIVVKAENFKISSGTIEKSLPLSEGKYVKISIQDHGVGIPEEHLYKIFDPYFSTKEKGTQKGMGLGLATTYSIVNRHDGHITAESEVGVGTTFTIYLPAAVEEIAGIEPVKMVETEKPAILTGRMLVMDDEEAIRMLLKQMLSRLSYEPEMAKDGAEAIELYKRAMDSGKPFDAVILDLTIKGGAGGKEVIKQLMEIDPDIKAIVSSGYSNDPVVTNFIAYGFIGALPKPYTKKKSE